MIGRELAPPTAREETTHREIVLTCEGVRARGDRGEEALRGVGLEVHAGEVLGIAGVSGNGQRELAECILGVRLPAAGTIRFRGTDVTTLDVRRMRLLGTAYVPEDPRVDGVVLQFTVADNFILGRQDPGPFARVGVLDAAVVRGNGARLAREYDVRPLGPQRLAGTLSGGNQQKVVLGPELSAQPVLLVASEPTRGLDIAGTIINIAAFGITGYLNRLVVTPSGRGGAGVIPPFHLPAEATALPIVGPLLAMFFNQGPIAMAVLVVVLALQFFLFRSRWGLRTRAVGEHPKAADTVGIDVFRQRYLNVILGGALAGLVGAFLTLESTGSFQNGMTGGRGFIALAAMIFGRWTPIGAFAGSLLFGTATALGVMVNVRPPEGDLGSFMQSIPTFWYAALPYVATIVILAGVVGRSIPPAADGVPYEKEGRA